MNSIYAILPVVVLLLMGLIQSAFGQRPPQGPPPPSRIHPEAMSKLNLTDTQKQQISVLEVNGRELTEDQHKIVGSVDEQLRMMVDSGTFSDESAMRLIRVKADAMSKIELVRLRIDAAIAKVLTADQKAQIARLRTDRRPPPPGVDPRPDGQ